jgi:hypothetical protein
MRLNSSDIYSNELKFTSQQQETKLGQRATTKQNVSKYLTDNKKTSGHKYFKFDFWLYYGSSQF